MASPNQSGLRVSKRNVLKALGVGALAGSGVATSAAGQQSQRPTISLSTPDCEELQISYTNGRVPLTAVVGGPTSYTETLSPGDTPKRSVDPGVYTVTATPAPDQAQGKDQGQAVLIEGSPQTVAACEEGGVTVTPYCETAPDAFSPNRARFVNTTGEVVFVRVQWYRGEEAIAPQGFLLSPDRTEWIPIDPELFGSQPPTHVTFTANLRETNDPVTVSPSRLDFPEDLPCADSTPPDDGSGEEPGEITGQISVRMVCTTLSDIEGWYYIFYQQNDSNVPVTLQLDVFSGETLLSSWKSSLLYPDLEMSFGQFHETYLRDANVTHMILSATSETGASVPVDPARWDVPADLPSC